MALTQPKVMIHPLGEPKQQATDTTRLIPSSHSKSRHLNYGTIFFLMLNRSINLVFYKILITFSYYFAQYFQMNYTIFAITVLNLGSILNMPVSHYYSQYKAKYVIIIFELMLCIPCLLILQWHNIAGLLIARLILTFIITAIRSEVNAIVGKYTHGKRRTNSIGIIELSFGLSGLIYIFVGYVLQHFGYKILFIGWIILIAIIVIFVSFLVPAWHTNRRSKSISRTRNRRNSQTHSMSDQLKEALAHKRLQLIFISVLLNKIARNAFYYTFSKWLATDYNFGPLEAGYMTLCITFGCLFGTIIVPLIIKYFKIHNFLSCLLSSLMQICAMIPEPIFHFFGEDTSILSLCFIIFFYFCGCQIWYNNILDIMIGVTPSPKLLPAVNTILLISGLCGGIIGTIGSTVWYQWGGHIAIAIVCAVCNIGSAFIVILLWIAHTNHSLRLHIEAMNHNNEGDVGN